MILPNATRGSKSTHYKRLRLEGDAKLLSRQGFDSWQVVSKIEDEAIGLPMEDLRYDGTLAIELSPVSEIPPRLEQEKPSNFPFNNHKKRPIVGEVAIPSRMRRSGAALIGMTSFPPHRQEMANVFRKEFNIDQKKDPPVTPLVHPKPRERHWRVGLPSHERANKARKDSSPNKTNESPHRVIIQAWLIYIRRFVLFVNLFSAWPAFGGLAAQLSHLITALRRAIAENSTLVITYDNAARSRIQRLARLRDSDTYFARIPTEEIDEIKQPLKTIVGGIRPKRP